MEKIRIITDSAADLDNIRPEVTVIPMKISFGSETYLDGVNLSHMTSWWRATPFP